MQVIVEKKVPSIRLAAIDGRLESFFYSNKNNFVQLEDIKIKTERVCSMQHTEQTTVLHHSSLADIIYDSQTEQAGCDE